MKARIRRGALVERVSWWDSATMQMSQWLDTGMVSRRIKAEVIATQKLRNVPFTQPYFGNAVIPPIFDRRIRLVISHAAIPYSALPECAIKRLP